MDWLSVGPDQAGGDGRGDEGQDDGICRHRRIGGVFLPNQRSAFPPGNDQGVVRLVQRLVGQVLEVGDKDRGRCVLPEQRWHGEEGLLRAQGQERCGTTGRAQVGAAHGLRERVRIPIRQQPRQVLCP